MRAGATCRRHTCLRHAANLCECPPAKWRLAFRHSIAQLEELHESVRSRIPNGEVTPCSSVTAVQSLVLPAAKIIRNTSALPCRRRAFLWQIVRVEDCPCVTTTPSTQLLWIPQL
jgi:hypothetical protein